MDNRASDIHSITKRLYRYRMNNALKKVCFLIELKDEMNLPMEGTRNLEWGIRETKRLLKKSETASVEEFNNIINMTLKVAESWELGAQKIEFP